jgi:hypothetical protein
MKDILILLGMLVIFLAPIVAIGWIVYRAIKGSGGDNYSIK